MTTYEAPRYKELGFYVDGNYRKFSGGFYSTDDAAEIAVLDVITDAVRIDTPEEKPAPKAPVARKAAANSSAK
ncbi:hypothetical protein BK120_08320 [Paenibacillus sp. FSL A5-0031]|uniref:hypothetical protein n=1 Tax=Paenibacillus sp. FSL A5-0031 TaxID=1920420 RepID=UPI00096E92FB|nr:hypothetical protein [Paenibacillus sp. FSL A5-0031]OME86918.1 hypothetical protein BK120_08320 [Paenibacillus sp. FSL A5-0031]